MTKFFQQVFNILTSPPGNLIYHLILVFSIAIALQIALSSQRRSEPKQTKRVLLGLGILLAGQMLLFLSSGLAWQNIADPQFYLPPVDRAVTAFSLIWLIWILVFPKTHRAADAVNGLLNLVVLILLVFTLATWRNSDPALAFNNSVLDLGWGILCIFLSLTGILLLLLEKPASWGIGVSVLLLHITGYVVHLLYTGQVGDFAAPLRLAQICAYPLLPILILRSVEVHPAPSISLPSKKEESFIERRRYSADPRAAYGLLNLAIQEKEEDIYEALTRAVAQTLLADLCLLFQASPFSEELLLRGGYDLIREEDLPSQMTLQKSTLPTIAGAIQRGKPLMITAQEQSLPDFDALVEILGLEKPGNLLLVPISVSNTIWGGLVLLSPYSNRIWENQDETYLSGAVDLLAQFLEKTEQWGENQKTLQQLQNELEIAQLQLSSLKSEQPPAATSTTAESLRPKPQTEEELEKLIALQRETQQIVEQLKAENEQLTAKLASTTNSPSSENTHAAKLSEMRSELRLALQELAHLQNELADTNLKNVKLEKELELSTSLPQNNPQVVNAIFQELRQPLASIVGYTDLLLSETGGILGALQQNFLKRIKASLGRIDSVLKNPNGIDDASTRLISAVNLSSVIDKSISVAGEQLREKKVTLRMDMPDQLPNAIADEDTLEQIIGNLLNNAVMASPFEGTVTLRVTTEDREDLSYLLIQVEDTGGGIEPRDLQRVFSRRYRGDNPVVKGIGDTGVGLTIAKTLTEALDGRIWVHSEVGQGTTFSVLLPIIPEEDLTADSQE